MIPRVIENEEYLLSATSPVVTQPSYSHNSDSTLGYEKRDGLAERQDVVDPSGPGTTSSATGSTASPVCGICGVVIIHSLWEKPGYPLICA